MSIRMRAGCWTHAISKPSSAVVTSMIRYPLNSRIFLTNFRFLSLSSTTKISSPAMWLLQSCKDCADVQQELLLAEMPFLGQVADAAIQTILVFAGESPGREDHDWDAGCGGVVLELVHHLKAVHFRHQKIKHDEIGALSPGHSKAFWTALGL